MECYRVDFHRGVIMQTRLVQAGDLPVFTGDPIHVQPAQAKGPAVPQGQQDALFELSAYEAAEPGPVDAGVEGLPIFEGANE